MDLSAFSGKAEQAVQTHPWAIAGVFMLCAALTVGYAEHTRSAAVRPLVAQLHTLQTQVDTLHEQEQPQPRPVDWHLAELRTLATTLPQLESVDAKPATAHDAGGLGLVHFDGAVLRLSIKGSLRAVVALCRKAQATLPLWIETVSSKHDKAEVSALLFGTHRSAP